MNAKPFSLIGAPIDCLGFDGPLQAVEKMPDSLRRAGIAARLGAEDLGDLAIRIGAGARDAETGVISLDDCRAITATLRRETAALLARGVRPLFLGGCCSLAPGVLAGLRDHAGSAALVYVDGHMDLYDGVTSWQGEMADMPLAILFGHGPAPAFADALGDLATLNENVYLLAYRDRDEALGRGSRMPEALEPRLKHWDLDRLRALGFAAVGAQLAAHLAESGAPIYLHIDLDALDESVFPATMYHLPRGLLWDELHDLLAPLAELPNLAAVSIACYDPDMDDGERLAPEIIARLGALFAV